ncbi:hypothetical protein [Saccharopolyspora tripterygii]
MKTSVLRPRTRGGAGCLTIVGNPFSPLFLNVAALNESVVVAAETAKWFGANGGASVLLVPLFFTGWQQGAGLLALLDRRGLAFLPTG